MEAVSAAWDRAARRDRRRRRAGPVSSSARSPGCPPRRLTSTPESSLPAVESLLGGIDPSTAASGAPRSSHRPAPSTCCSRAGDREPVELTLDAMAAGGIHDQLGGGFARYAVDAIWLVPHFEKMLYDNALLARSYLRAISGARPRALSRRRRRRSATGRCGRCADPRAGSTPPSMPIPRASRGASTPGPRPRPERRSTAPDSITTQAALLAHLGNRRRRPSRRPQRPPPARPASMHRRAGEPRAGQGSAARGPRRTGPAGPRRQAPLRLERAHGRIPGRDRGGARMSHATSTPLANASTSS